MFARRQAGFTLVETMVSMVIIGIATMTIFMFLGSMARQTSNVKHQTFATQKAIQIMEELRSLVGRTDRIGILDNYDNGSGFSPFLTTENTTTLSDDPSNPLSGNIRVGTGWKYLRQVSVLTELADPFMRKVYVRIYLSDPDNPSVPKTFLSQSVSIIKTSVSGCISAQVMDVYFLNIENIPGWWTSSADLKPMTDEMINDLQTRNPGLEIRSHWITRLSYGRDPYYTPWINEGTRADLLADLPYVYYYPGLVRKRTSGGVDYNELYYVPGNFIGKVNIEGSVANPGSYSVADQFNNAVRYPDEERLYAQYGGEMSLRMLIEKLNSSPTEMRNALIVNMHGELLPLPPVRNYSDPAKDPAANPNVRVVTHPGNLQYALADPVVLRVYSFVTDTPSWAHNSVLNNMTICFPNRDLTGAITVQKCIGNTVVDYAWTAGVTPNSYTLALTADGTTVLTLFDSPLRHPQNAGSNRGLSGSACLYGLEYIPCAIHPAGTPAFTYELTWNNPNVAKNTARWKISIAGAGLSAGTYTVDTRIGNNISTDYPNLSRTYFWYGTTPPVTEQYQFTGDPRHCPYLDVKANDRYNWYFCSIPAGDYQGYTKTANGWDGDHDGVTLLNIDVPRYFQVWRTGLLASNAVFTPITGWSFHFVGLGGEMGGDQSSDLPDGVQAVGKPWSTTGAMAIARVNEIMDRWAATSYTVTNARLIARTDNSWCGLYWIGELWPDTQWANWVTDGNLASGAGNFYRAKSTLKLPFEPEKMSRSAGCLSFFNGIVSGVRTFAQDGPGSALGAITTDGNNLASIFNFPPVTPIDANRPITLNYNASGSYKPPEWNDSVYSGQRTTLSAEKIYYDSNYSVPDYSSSEGVKMTLGALAGYAVVQGLKPQTGFGAAEISRLALQGVLHQFLLAGEPTVVIGRIAQVPLVTVSFPKSGQEFGMTVADINIQWSIAWKRWDGEKYTSAYLDGFSEIEPVVYNIKYSDNNGTTWKFIQDGSQAFTGVRNAGYDFASGTVAYDWDISSLPRGGTYLLRIEAYRQTIPLHYTYQMMRIYIWR